MDGTGILRPILKVLIVLKTGQVLNSMGAAPELGSLMTHTSQRAGRQGSPQSPKNVFSYAPAPRVACAQEWVWWSMKCPALTHACVCFYVKPIEFCHSSIQEEWFHVRPGVQLPFSPKQFPELVLQLLALVTASFPGFAPVKSDHTSLLLRFYPP